jgi:hypothetical protein
MIIQMNSDEEQQGPTSQFVDLGSILPIYDSYESNSELDMLDFQENTTEPCPLFINKNHHEKISHPEQQIEEKSFPMGIVYDDYDYNPWESIKKKRSSRRGSS